MKNKEPLLMKICMSKEDGKVNIIKTTTIIKIIIITISIKLTKTMKAKNNNNKNNEKNNNEIKK